MPLSVFAIKNAKPKAKPYKLTDFESLYLLVKPIGSKLWQMGYSYLGKQKTLSFGPFPRTSLAEAHQKYAMCGYSFRQIGYEKQIEAEKLSFSPWRTILN